jgi:hypothetical protein
MERYKRFFNDYIIIKESVIHVNKYFEVVLKDFIKFIDSHTKTDFKDSYDFWDKFTASLIKYNIRSIFTEKTKKAFIYEGGSGVHGSILLFCSNHNEYYSVDSVYGNEEAKKELINDFTILCSHELVHRVQQAYSSIVPKQRVSKLDERKEAQSYFSQPEEIMAYAFHCIEECRVKGHHDNQILSILKAKNSLYNVSSIFAQYKYLFDNDELRWVFNKFKKYIYQYIVDPIKNELW